jgi:XTP/dITP diphosphohydrolase
VKNLVIATNNPHKFKEIQSILGNLPVPITSLSAFPDVPVLEEKGSTYLENAVHKARTVAQVTGHWALADDTGLEVDAIGGDPGLYSARYAGEGVSFDENKQKLLSVLEGIPWDERGALFRCVMALVSPSGETFEAEGTVSGYITEKEQGTGGFGYDGLFYLTELGKTLAELGPDDKNRVSHRARALEKLRKDLERIIPSQK